MLSDQRLRVGSLFSGIGGFDLGLERAGMRTEWFVEVDPFCQAVLKKHWPTVPCYGDIRSLTAHDLRPVDVLCGGFPCQDLSSAGKGAGLDGARSGLWSEFARLIGELRPRYVVVENVPVLRSRGLGRVLGEMATLGYDAEWDCIPAQAVGAPHRRDRVWIVAYPSDPRGQRSMANASGQRGSTGGIPELVARAPGEAQGLSTERQWSGDAADDCGSDVANADGPGRLEQRRSSAVSEEITTPQRSGAPMADTGGVGRNGPAPLVGQSDQDTSPAERCPRGAFVAKCNSAGRDGTGHPSDHWAVEPDVGRVADGVPARMDRLRSLGNALVPQIAEWIGRGIVDYESA